MKSIYQRKNMKNLTGDLPDKCNGLLRNCKECDYHYPGPNEMNCPECSAPREYCSNDPIRGSSRCKFHGGESPKGIQHYNYQGKGLSKHLPERFMQFYASTYEDSQLLEMNESIRLLEGRKYELISRWDEIGSRNWVKELADAMSSYKDARRKAVSTQRPTDVQKAEEALYKLEQLIYTAYSERQIWDEIRSIEEQVRKIKNSELQRQKMAEEIVTKEQFFTLMRQILGHVQAQVDRETFENIMEEVRFLEV